MTPASLPAKPVLETFAPEMSIVQSLATAAPPWSFTTCLVTVKAGLISSLVMMQVLDSPRPMAPAQFPENVVE